MGTEMEQELSHGKKRKNKLHLELAHGSPLSYQSFKRIS